MLKKSWEVFRHLVQSVVTDEIPSRIQCNFFAEFVELCFSHRKRQSDFFISLYSHDTEWDGVLLEGKRDSGVKDNNKGEGGGNVIMSGNFSSLTPEYFHP